MKNNNIDSKILMNIDCVHTIFRVLVEILNQNAKDRKLYPFNDALTNMAANNTIVKV